jgi:hypothetical protein
MLKRLIVPCSAVRVRVLDTVLYSVVMAVKDLSVIEVMQAKPVVLRSSALVITIESRPFPLSTMVSGLPSHFLSVLPPS